MPTTTELEERMRSLPADDLVFVLLGRPEWDERLPLVAASSHNVATTTRLAFAEIAERWLPPGLYHGAVSRMCDDRT